MRRSDPLESLGFMRQTFIGVVCGIVLITAAGTLCIDTLVLGSRALG